VLVVLDLLVILFCELLIELGSAVALLVVRSFRAWAAAGKIKDRVQVHLYSTYAAAVLATYF